MATFGFNRVWSNRADSVANQLQPFDIESLSTHNIKQELDSFRATCEKIEEKRVIAEAGICPRWLLVLVNKIDLYRDGRVQAEDYYRPTCKSPFDDVAQQHLPLTDPVLDFQYRVLPVTLNPEQYRFTSNVGEMAIPTQLGSHHVEASLRLLIRSLEDLCGV